MESPTADAGDSHGCRNDEAELPLGVDPTKPNVARVYDYMLGGKDNYEADRAQAKLLLEKVPHLRRMAWLNRHFLKRVVRYLAGEAGIRQFLDIGSGLPTQENVHQVAQSIAPDARTVYVDNDPVVLAHGRALLTATPNTHVVEGDLRTPERIIRDASKHLDLSQPVAVLLIAILHFFPSDDPYDIVRDLVASLAPGSYLAVSHLESAPVLVEALKHYKAAEVFCRGSDEVARFFDDTPLVEPGVVRVSEWRPEKHESDIPQEHPNDSVWVLGGVGRKQ